MYGLKKVIHIIPKFSKECWGGAESALLNLCPRLSDHGFKCEVWSPAVFGGSQQEVMDGVFVRRFPGFYLSPEEERLAGRGKAQLSVSLLWSILTSRGVDLIHLHCHNRLSSLAAACALVRRIPLVLTLHYGYRSFVPRWRYFFPAEFAIRNAHMVISVSQTLESGVRQAFPSLPSTRLTCIGNGANIEPFSKSTGDQFRKTWCLNEAPIILNVGRICPQKNQSFLVRIFPEVQRQVANAHLVLIGPVADHQYYQQLMADIQASPCRSKIRLIPGLPPESDELREAYAAADVFVLPSREEGLPLTILEAWAAGKPVVASNVAGNSELIRSGENGLLFDLERGEEELPQQIIHVLLSADSGPRLGGAGRDTLLANYTWDAIATQLANAYQTLLERNGRG